MFWQLSWGRGWARSVLSSNVLTEIPPPSWFAELWALTITEPVFHKSSEIPSNHWSVIYWGIILQGSVFFFYFLEGLPVNNPFWCPWYLLRKKIISFYQTQHFWSYVRCVKKRSPPKFDDIQNIAFLTLLCSFKKKLEIWSTSCTAFLFQVLLPKDSYRYGQNTPHWSLKIWNQ